MNVGICFKALRTNALGMFVKVIWKLSLSIKRTDIGASDTQAHIRSQHRGRYFQNETSGSGDAYDKDLLRRRDCMPSAGADRACCSGRLMHLGLDHAGPIRMGRPNSAVHVCVLVETFVLKRTIGLMSTHLESDSTRSGRPGKLVASRWIATSAFVGCAPSRLGSVALGLISLATRRNTGPFPTVVNRRLAKHESLHAAREIACRFASIKWPLSFATFLTVSGMGGVTPAYAADVTVPSSNGSVASPTLQVQTNAPVDPKSLAIKGLNIGLPGPADTIDPDIGGARSELAKAGIGYIGMSLNNFYDNTLPHAFAPTHAQQLYNGQNFTASSQNFMFVTYDLSRFGIPDGQIVVAAGESVYTWNAGGPSRFGLTMATFYQTFLDRTFELKLGYVHNGWEFAGTGVGGSLASSVFGPAGSIIYQGGFSNANVPTPGAILKYNIGAHFYDKATVQRSVSPDGQVAEVNANPAAVNWTVPNAGVLYLNEFGYQRDAAPSVPQMWIRAGAAYNTSNYNNKEIPGTRAEGNSFYYLLADRQLWQSVPVRGSAGRGIYAGFSVMYAPPEFNTISQYYEGRLYGKGLFDRRPDDLISLVLTDTVFSKYSVYQALLKNQLTHTDSKAITVSYSAHLAPGIYASLGLSYVDHPTSVTYTTKTGSALNALAAFNVFW